MKMSCCIKYLLLVLTLFSIGCAVGHDQVMSSPESQLKLRSIQSRAFDSTDKVSVLRAAIATLQDLRFVIDKADTDLGTVTATKFYGRELRATVFVKPRGTTQMLVRMNAQYHKHPVVEPKPYQEFFSALSKSLFLQAHQVD